MIPHRQTIFATPDGPPGNCLQTAVAALLDLDLDEVPHFVAIDTAGGEHWWTHLRRWCHQRHLRISHDPPGPGELHIVRGWSPRAPTRCHHVAIYRDDQLVHDPHPDGTGVLDIVGRWTIRPITPG